MPLDLKKIRNWVDAQPSVAAAARMLGLQPPNLHRLMSGDHADVKISTLERFAGVMGVGAAELISHE